MTTQIKEMGYYSKPKKDYKSIEDVNNDIGLTQNQKDTEIFLLSSAFTLEEQHEMYRLLRALVDENISTLHYQGSNYRKFLLDCSQSFFERI